MLPKIGHKQSLSDHAYMVIKEAILNNTIKPKDILLEESIAAMLGISRTPLRTALKRLEFENLVFTNTSKQAVVAEIHPEDMVQVFVFRLAVEPMIARMASSMRTEEHLAQIEDCLTRNDIAIKKKDLITIIACELEFDTVLAACTHNEFLVGSISTIHRYMQRFLTLSTTTYDDAFGSIDEHRLILDAVREKNANEAEKRTQSHVRQVVGRLKYELPI